MPRAYVYTAHGGPEVERFQEVPSPAPGDGQLLVAVRAAGVNPADWKRRSGLVPAAGPEEFPTVLGLEVSGVVVAVGTGVEGFSVGDAVLGNPLTGGFAQYTLLSAGFTAPKPDALTFTDAAALPVAAATAFDGVRQLGLPEGATLLINGVGGGVGVAAAQIAGDLGIRVVGTAGAAKKDLVESLGVAYAESGPGVAERVAAAAPRGVDAIFDLVGGEALEAVAGLLEDRSKLVTAGDPVTAGRLGGSMVRRARDRAVLEEVAALAARGRLRPMVTEVFPFERTAEAMRSVERGHTLGKIVVEVSG